MGIILITVLALILRLLNLSQSLWLDEAVQAMTAKGPLGGILPELYGDFHPPLYHFLIWVWVRVFGESEVSLRLPSVLFGTATIYVVYLIAKECLNHKFSIFTVSRRIQLPIPETAALLIATAPFHIYYSQEARMYSMTTFFAALSMYFFIKIIKENRGSPEIKISLGYILATTALIYSDYYGLLVFATQVGFSFIFLRKVKGWGTNFFFTMVLFLPCLFLLTRQIQFGRQATILLPGWKELVNLGFLKALPLTFIKFSIGRITVFNKKIYALLSLFLFFTFGALIFRAIWSFWRATKRKKLIFQPQLLIILWFVVPVLAAWLLSYFVPNYQPFRLLLVLPAFYLLLAWGAFRFRTTIIYIIVAIILGINLVSTSVYLYNPHFHREDWRGLVRFVEKSGGKKMAILPSATSDWPWRYYSAKETNLLTVSQGIKQIDQRDLLRVKIPYSCSSIYYIRYLVPLFDPKEKIVSWLGENGFVKIKEVSFNQIPVWAYKRK